MIYLPLLADTPTFIDSAFIENVALAIGQEADQQSFFPGVVQAEIAHVLTGWVMDAYTHETWRSGKIVWVSAPFTFGKSTVMQVGRKND